MRVSRFNRFFCSWRRWLVVVGALLLLSVPVCWFVTTRSWFLVGQARPTLERFLGGPIQIEHASLQRNGQVEFTNVSLRIPDRGLQSPAGEIMTIGRLIVTMKDRLLWLPGGQVTDIEVDNAVLRLSENTRNAGQYSFMALAPRYVDPTRTPSRIADSSSSQFPRIRVRRILVEVGVHNDTNYLVHGRRRFAGECYPTTKAGHYNFQLAEIDGPGSKVLNGGLNLKGEWNVITGERAFRLDELHLDKSTYAMCPFMIRLWWDRMNLKGKVDNLMVQQDSSGRWGLATNFRDVDLTLPVEASTSETWVRLQAGHIIPATGSPRMIVRDGTLRVGPEPSLECDLTGELTTTAGDPRILPVPCHLVAQVNCVPLELSGKGASHWTQEMMMRSSFVANLRIDLLELTPGSNQLDPAIEMPAVLAQVLQRFELRRGLLSSDINIKREPPSVGALGKLVPSIATISGQMYISKGVGRLSAFPYPMFDCDAYVQFDPNGIKLHSLVGKCGQTGLLRFSGSGLATSSRWSTLNVAGQNIPADAGLRSTLDAAGVGMSVPGKPESANQSINILDTDRLVEDALIVKSELTGLLAKCTIGEHALDRSDAFCVEVIDRMKYDLERVRRLATFGPFDRQALADLEIRIEAPNTTTISTTGQVTLKGSRARRNIDEARQTLEMARPLLKSGTTSSPAPDS